MVCRQRPLAGQDAAILDAVSFTEPCGDPGLTALSTDDLAVPRIFAAEYSQVKFLSPFISSCCSVALYA